MSELKKPTYRKRHLFARSLDEVVKQATKPMMDKQGKLYSALLANWTAIVGTERAEITRPDKLQFPTGGDATGATLHLSVHPAHAPALQYEMEAILEQCARYFGYRAVTRIILHPAHAMMREKPPEPAKKEADPQSMQELLQRLRQRIMSGS